jgi:DNA primase
MRSSILDRTTLPDVLRLLRIPTTQRNGRIAFLCPAHDDHNPSAVVVGNRGWICFACNAHGGLLHLIIAAGRANTLAEAARWLETRTGGRR